MVVVLPKANNGTSSWEKDGDYIFEGLIITGCDSIQLGRRFLGESAVQ